MTFNVSAVLAIKTQNKYMSYFLQIYRIMELYAVCFATKYKGKLEPTCSDVNFVRELYNYCMHAVASQSVYIKGNTLQMKAEISDKFFSASPWPLVNLGQL